MDFISLIQRLFMLRHQHTLLFAITVLSSTTLWSDDLELNDPLRRAISPVIHDVEAAVLRKPHRPFDTFLADDAVFEESDSPLRAHLERKTTKNKEFPATSSLHWLRLSDSTLAPLFQRGYPQMDPKQTIMVYREIERKKKQLKAYGYLLCLKDGKWKVVLHFDGSGPIDGLAKNSRPFTPVD
ncbi:MAG: hypothetical protein AAFU85_31165 [Planctomycetota bacterium]